MDNTEENYFGPLNQPHPALQKFKKKHNIEKTFFVYVRNINVENAYFPYQMRWVMH